MQSGFVNLKLDTKTTRKVWKLLDGHESGTINFMAFCEGIFPEHSSLAMRYVNDSSENALSSNAQLCEEAWRGWGSLKAAKAAGWLKSRLEENGYSELDGREATKLFEEHGYGRVTWATMMRGLAKLNAEPSPGMMKGLSKMWSSLDKDNVGYISGKVFRQHFFFRGGSKVPPTPFLPSSSSSITDESSATLKEVLKKLSKMQEAQQAAIEAAEVRHELTQAQMRNLSSSVETALQRAAALEARL